MFLVWYPLNTGRNIVLHGAYLLATGITYEGQCFGKSRIKPALDHGGIQTVPSGVSNPFQLQCPRTTNGYLLQRGFFKLTFLCNSTSHQSHVLPSKTLRSGTE